MSPGRIVKRRFWPLYLLGVVVATSLALSAWAFSDRAGAINELIRDQQILTYQNCVSNENQDTVIVSILRTIPPRRRSPVVVDAINTLEPPGEKDCPPPEGTQP